MADPSFAPRRYDLLFAAMNQLLAVLADDGDERAALERTFAATADGFGARSALLLLVESVEPLALACVHSRGTLTPAQIQACERGESVKGVSPSVIRRVAQGARTELIADPRLRQDAGRTGSLEGADFSVVCAPIRDPLRERVLAVLYLQNEGLAHAYGEADRDWLQSYADVVGRLFGVHFAERRRGQELRTLLDQREAPEDAPEIVGDSAHTQELRRLLHEVYIPACDAPRPDPLLVLGERGTGKDLVARYLHAWSARRKRPLVVANCAEISDELAAARFFGHKRGAFTGALQDEPGFFRAAHNGVLFLDEIGDLSLRAQGALLRVLENRAVQPVGETREFEVDVAVVLATNHDLDQAVRDGRLRPDFHDRFRTQALRIAPLRERPWDVPALLEHFRLGHERRCRKRTLGFGREALQRLVAHAWPGNVREVDRTCSALITHARPGTRLDLALVERCAPDVAAGAPNPRAAPWAWDGQSFEEAVTTFKRELLLARLARHEGDTRSVRDSLGLAKTTFHRHLAELGISLPRRGRDELEPDS